MPIEETAAPGTPPDSRGTAISRPKIVLSTNLSSNGRGLVQFTVFSHVPETISSGGKRSSFSPTQRSSFSPTQTKLALTARRVSPLESGAVGGQVKDSQRVSLINAVKRNLQNN